MNEEVARTILLAEDDETLRARLARAFEARGYEVWTAGSTPEALEVAAKESPEYAVVDLRMPGASGLDLVKGLHELDASTVIVVLTGYGSIATALEAVRHGATHYLTKPADVDEIVAAFSRGEGSTPAAPAPLPDAVPSLARVEWEHINRVLTDCHGNISQAARLLGLHRRSLQRKLAKYPLPR
jgi:two-component system response regulator RegA